MSSFHHYAKIAKKILNESENKIDTASNLYFSDIDEKIFVSKNKDFDQVIDIPATSRYNGT
jgi:hypothetical protein